MRSGKVTFHLLGWSGLAFLLIGVVFEVLGDRNEKTLEYEMAQSERIQGLRVYPNEGNLEAMEAALAQRTEQIEAQIKGMSGSGFESKLEGPESAESLLFDLVKMEDQLTRYVEANGVDCSTEGHFGFGDVIDSNEIKIPEGVPHRLSSSWLSWVARERILMERVLRLLIESEPREIVKIERIDFDVFSLDDRSEAKLFNDFVRLEFVGKTETLRRFMLRLMDADYPVVIRLLGVEPWAAEANGIIRNKRSEKTKTRKGEGKGKEDRLSSDAVAIVQVNESKFELVLATYELKEATLQ